MGWKEFLFLSGIRKSLAKPETKTAFSQPPLWDPEHPLQQIWGPGTRPDRESIESNFEAYVANAYKHNGPVAACVMARSMVLSEAAPSFRELKDGRPGELSGRGTPALKILEEPWPNGTAGELFARMDQDAIFAGNSYWTRQGDRLVRMRPDWVQMVIGVPGDGDSEPRPNDLRAELLMYIYQPRTVGLGGAGSPDGDAVYLLPEQVVHYSPNPDPMAKFRGMAYLTPLVREVEADMSATLHKKAFLENAAVPNLAVKFDKDTSEDAFEEFVEQFNVSHKGAWNAYKTLFLMGGADVTPLTMDFHQLEFNQSIGKGESRIAAVLGTPSSWVGFSEGMQGSALNAGNFSAARRRFADGTIRPTWRMMVAALARVVDVPAGQQLWWDERDIAFLREDLKDRAEIFQTQMSALDSAIKAGFEADAAVKAANSFDVLELLGNHTGLVSVQMQPPGQARPQEPGQGETGTPAPSKPKPTDPKQPGGGNAKP